MQNTKENSDSPNGGNNFRRDKIPVWIVSLNALVVLILCFKTYAAFVAPQLVYGMIDAANAANQKVLWELAGRNIAMLVVTLLAMRSRNAMFYAFTFLINIVREGFDMVIVLKFVSLGADGIMQAASFLIFLVPYFFALRKLRSLARGP